MFADKECEREWPFIRQVHPSVPPRVLRLGVAKWSMCRVASACNRTLICEGALGHASMYMVWLSVATPELLRNWVAWGGGPSRPPS
jgi:hypothetical protein